MLKIKEKLKPIKWSRKKIGIILIVLALIVTSAVIINNKKKAKSTTSNYLTVPVQRGSVEETVEGTGTLQPGERYTFKSKTDGTVEDILVTEGTPVKKGDLIMRISNENIETQNKAAALEWELAENDYNDTLNPNIDENNDIQTAKMKVEKCKIALDSAKEQVDKLTVKAPFDGTILESELKVGQKVNTGVTAFKFASAGEMEAVAKIGQQDISSIVAGMDANIFVQGLNKSYPGKVNEVAYSGDSTSGTFEVILSLDSPDANLKAGMQTYNTIITANDPPKDILLYKQGSGYLRYTEEESTVTEVSGTVTEILQKPGVKLYKGEPILKLKNDELERQVKDAQLQLSIADEELELLINPDSDTAKQKQLKVLQSYQGYLSAKEKADSLLVTSPIDGVVVSIAVSPGEELSSETLEQELVVVSSFAKTELEITVDELDINKLKLGQEASIAVDALSGKTLKGTISGIAYEGTTTNDITKYKVKLDVEYTDGIKGGMSATATISLGKKDNVLRVPAEAVTTEKGNSTVQVLENGQATTKKVELGLSSEKWIEIVSGLEEGDKVIVASSGSTSQMNQMGIPGMGGPPQNSGSSSQRSSGSSNRSSSSSKSSSTTK